MLGLIIFGTRGVTYGSQGGEFFCPDCGGKTPYRHRKVRRFFTLYFIPLIPLDQLGEYVECQSCQSTYKMGVLEIDPEADDKREKAEFRQAMRRVLVMMSLADGTVDDSEVTQIQTILSGLEKRQVARGEVEAEIAQARAAGGDVHGYCQSMAGFLNDNGREMVVKAAYAVAAADGHFDQTEKDTLMRIAQALNLSKAHFNGIVAELQGGPPAS